MPHAIRRTILSTVVAATLAAPAAAQADHAGFQTPSGNIVCEYASAYVACDVKSVGGYYVLKRGGLPSAYRGTRGLDGYRTLGYGSTMRMGSFKCRSSFAGLRCTNRGGHGFFLSKQERYRF
jgi:hypothetical protein